MNGKKFVRANGIACAAAAAVLLFLFLFPHFMMRRLSPQLRQGTEEAKKCVLAEDWTGAETEFAQIQDAFLRKKAFLKMFFNHEDVDELSVAFDTCGAMIAIEEPQALAELARIGNIAQYLYEIEAFRWYSFI
ncbi:MAG: DUF4363 family protein [Clostridiales bacterium]|nr:DUF4363 family protein [Clostridiales bacterium]